MARTWPSTAGRHHGRGRRAVLVAAALALGLVTAACGSGPSQGKLKEGDQLKVGISTAALDTKFFSVLGSTLKAATEDQGGKVVQMVSADRDSGKQVTDIRNLITAGANVIVASVVDREALKPALDYAESKNVPVIIVDDLPASGTIYEAVKADNYGMGVTAADHMGKLLPDGGQVLNLTGAIETTNGRDRAAGFTDTIKKKYPKITVVEKSADWDVAKSASVMSAFLSANKTVAGVYLASDSLYYEPVAAALKARGMLKPVGDPGHVAVVGIDGSPEALSAIRSNFLDATVSQPVDQYGSQAISALVNARAGKAPTEGATDHGSTIKKTDGYFVDLLTAPLVTKDNVDDAKLWGNGK